MAHYRPARGTSSLIKATKIMTPKTAEKIHDTLKIKVRVLSNGTSMDASSCAGGIEGTPSPDFTAFPKSSATFFTAGIST